MSRVIDFPVSLRLAGKRVTLIGGGKIAEARAEQLLEAGARLTVISPETSAQLRAHAKAGRLALLTRPYRLGDLEGAELAFSATNDRAVSASVAEEARARKVLLNAADEPDLCDFTLPSVGRRGSITVAVSTEGMAPAVAARLRRKLLASIGIAPRARVWASAVVRTTLPRTQWRTKALRWIAGGARPEEAPSAKNAEVTRVTELASLIRQRSTPQAAKKEPVPFSGHEKGTGSFSSHEKGTGSFSSHEKGTGSFSGHEKGAGSLLPFLRDPIVAALAQALRRSEVEGSVGPDLASTASRSASGGEE